MAKKRNVKKIKKELANKKETRRLPVSKSDGIMALMGAVLVILTSVLDLKIALTLAIVLIILFGVYKLFLGNR